MDMIGQSGSQSDVMMDEVDGPDLSALRKAEMDKLHMKMQKTMERIKAEQREKEGEWGKGGRGGRGGDGGEEWEKYVGHREQKRNAD